jgi:hypothetical protein
MSPTATAAPARAFRLQLSARATQRPAEEAEGRERDKDPEEESERDERLAPVPVAVDRQADTRSENEERSRQEHVQCITVQETFFAKNAVLAGSAALFVRTPKTCTAAAPPTQTITPATWRNSQNSYEDIARVVVSC